LPAFADFFIVAMRKAHNEFKRAGHLGGFLDIRIAGVQPAIADIFADRT
jgi:hypothetical protein